MKKIFDTSIGNGSETAFKYSGERVLDISKIPSILESECSPHTTRDDQGVIVYMSKVEFERLDRSLDSKNEEENYGPTILKGPWTIYN